jgi:hypothetical protein
VAGLDPQHRAGRRKLAIGLMVGAIASAVALGIALAGPDSTAGQHAPCPRVKSPSVRHLSTLRVGLNAVWNRDCDLRALARAGIRWERLEVMWSVVEPRPGRWRFGRYDTYFEEAARAGITVLPLLNEAPSWAPEQGIPQTPGPFSDFVSRAVRRYGPGGSFWRTHRHIPYRPAVWFELWNEPYLSQFSAGDPDPAAYARIVKAAVGAGRQANPAARFLIEADTVAPQPDGSRKDWVGGMYSAVPDLNQWFDGVAVHPYSGPNTPPDYYTPGSSDQSQFRRIQAVHDAFVAHGAADKPFWITEVGWSTCPASTSSCLSPAQQARYTARMFQIVKTEYRQWVKAVFIYNYRDGLHQNAADKEDWFGVLRFNGTPKPVWYVLEHAAGAG